MFKLGLVTVDDSNFWPPNKVCCSEIQGRKFDLILRAALAPELPKQPCGDAGGMVEDAEEISGPCLVLGPERNQKLESGRSVARKQTQNANAAVQAERSTPIKFLRSLEYGNALSLNAIITLSFVIGVHLHGKRYTRIAQFLNLHQQTTTFRDLPI